MTLSNLLMSAQASLKDFWLRGKGGCFSAKEQLQAWALRVTWREINDGVYGMHTWIAQRLTKNGGGQPTNNSVKDFFEKLDNDVDWFPGYVTLCKGLVGGWGKRDQEGWKEEGGRRQEEGGKLKVERRAEGNEGSRRGETRGDGRREGEGDRRRG